MKIKIESKNRCFKDNLAEDQNTFDMGNPETYMMVRR